MAQPAADQLFNGADTPPFAAGLDSGVDHPGVIPGVHTHNLDQTSFNQWVAALRSPDTVAEGKNIIEGMGDRSVNSSIGSQWRGGVTDLDKAAQGVPASERATTRMNAKLERCK